MKIEFVPENLSIPFPQANDVYKVLKFVDVHVANYHHDKFSFIKDDYVERQKKYYKAAAEYIGFFDSKGPTPFAQKIFLMDTNYLFLSTVQAILNHKIFFDYYSNRSKTQVQDQLIKHYKYSLSTAIRRSSTVQKWIEWCDLIIQENNVEVNYGD